jgi:type VI protein secretion system component VasF
MISGVAEVPDSPLSAHPSKPTRRLRRRRRRSRLVLSMVVIMGMLLVMVFVMMFVSCTMAFEASRQENPVGVYNTPR